MDKKTMEQVINGMADKIELLHEAVKISSEMQKISKDKTSRLNNKCDDLKRYTDKQLCHVSDKYDDLEAKNYELRRELDGIYKVLEMDACDIQKLQDKMEGK